MAYRRAGRKFKLEKLVARLGITKSDHSRRTPRGKAVSPRMPMPLGRASVKLKDLLSKNH